MVGTLGPAPKTAVRVTAAGSDDSGQIDAIVVGEPLRIGPGEKVAVDGELTEGKGTADESMVTGNRCRWLAKAIGSRMTACTIKENIRS